MKNRTLHFFLLAFFIGFSSIGLNAQVDVTSTYLTNAGFDTDANYLVASTDNLGPANDGSANLAVTGWDLAVNEYSTSATFEYGTSATMNGKAVPSVGSDGSTTGAGQGALGIMASWSAYIKYSQSVTLPAGTYTLSYKAYNANTGGTAGNSLVGWIPNEGSASMSTISGGFTSETWVSDEIIFVLESETTGIIQVGMEAGVHSNPDDKAHVFIDDLQLLYNSEILGTDATLSSITLDAGSLIPEFNPEVTDYIVVTPSETSSILVTPVLNDVNASYEGGGSVDVSAGEVIETIVVTSESGSSTVNYNITFTTDCYTPEFTDRDNLVADPLCNNRSSFGGWGSVAVTTDPTEVYCGSSSIVLGTGDTGCDAALDINPFNYSANTTYRVRAMLKTVGGSLGFLANSADPNYNDAFDTSGEWEQIDFFFTTGASPSASFVTFNKCDNGSNCIYAYIDNYEIYEVDNDVTLSSLTSDLGSLNPTFDAGTTSYELIVEPGTTAVTLTAAANSETSTVEGDGEITLTDGSATAEITVTAESDNTQTYTINVTSVSSDATLSDLTLSIGLLSPAFDGATTDYIAYVPSDASSVDVAATTNFEAASVTSGDGTVSFAIGETKEVLVTAENETTTETYNITFVAYGTIENAGFDDETINYIASATDAISASGDGATVYDIVGWTKNHTSWGAAASIEYGFAGTFNGNTIPATDVDGTSGSGVAGLAVCAAWGGTTFYTQEIALAAGTYNLTYDIINFGPATAGTSLAAWTPQGGSAVMSTLSDLEIGVWTSDEITFTVDDATLGTIQVGIQSPGNGSGSNGRYMIDNVQVTLDTSTDIDFEAVEKVAKVYPTISTGEVTVEFADAPKAITVYSLTGSVVKQIPNPSVKEVISIQGSGIYLIKVESETNTELVKVVIGK